MCDDCSNRHSIDPKSDHPLAVAQRFRDMVISERRRPYSALDHLWLTNCISPFGRPRPRHLLDEEGEGGEVEGEGEGHGVPYLSLRYRFVRSTQ